LRVLVVDDDPLVLSNTAAMIDDLGHSSETANSAARALSILQNEPFDVMVTDHAMPVMTGAQLLRETRARYPKMAVVLATGFAELPDQISETMRLRKPFNQAELLDALAKARGPHEEPRSRATSAMATMKARQSKPAPPRRGSDSDALRKE
jgi:CheY-like chemotaxis protein